MNTRIRDMREDADIKQVRIAKYLGVTQSTYSQYENGLIAIPCATFDKLANYYDTSVDYLMGRTEERKPYPKSKRPAL